MRWIIAASLCRSRSKLVHIQEGTSSMVFMRLFKHSQFHNYIITCTHIHTVQLMILPRCYIRTYYPFLCALSSWCWQLVCCASKGMSEHMRLHRVEGRWYNAWQPRWNPPTDVNYNGFLSWQELLDLLSLFQIAPTYIRSLWWCSSMCVSASLAYYSMWLT